MTATDHAIRLTRLAAKAASDKLGSDPVAFDVSVPLAITDVFLIVSAGNERQVGAIVDAVEEALLATSFSPVDLVWLLGFWGNQFGFYADEIWTAACRRHPLVTS